MSELRAIDAEIDNIYDHFWLYESSDLHRLYALRFWEQKRQEAAAALVQLGEVVIQCKQESKPTEEESAQIKRRHYNRQHKEDK